MLQEVWLERDGRFGHIGSIYRGTVSRVLPGLQAAFVDIGLERAAFLHASDMARNDPSLEQDETGTPLIAELLRAGEQITVQVIKDPMGSKGGKADHQYQYSVPVPGAFA